MKREYGEYRIPKVRLGILLDHLFTLYKKNTLDKFSKEDFRTSLNLAEKSSGNEEKIKDMIAFGLLNGDEYNSILSISDLGKKIITSNDIERTNELKKVIKHIPLWEKVLTEFETKNTTPFAAINEIFKKYPEITAEEIGKIKWAYDEDIKCITKRPPYAILSKNIGRTRPLFIQKQTSQQDIDIKKPQPIASSTLPILKEKEYSLIIHYGEHQIPVVDEMSFHLANKILKKIRRELEKHGVDLEE